MNRKYDLQDRLIAYAAYIIRFLKTLQKDDAGQYYGNQLLRSGGSTTLNFGEAQGTRTSKDYLYKISLVIKELKESKVNLKILEIAEYGDIKMRTYLLDESEQLIKITSVIKRNKSEK